MSDAHLSTAEKSTANPCQVILREKLYSFRDSNRAVAHLRGSLQENPTDPFVLSSGIMNRFPRLDQGTLEYWASKGKVRTVPYAPRPGYRLYSMNDVIAECENIESIALPDQFDAEDGAHWVWVQLLGRSSNNVGVIADTATRWAERGVPCCPEIRIDVRRRRAWGDVRGKQYVRPDQLIAAKAAVAAVEGKLLEPIPLGFILRRDSLRTFCREFMIRHTSPGRKRRSTAVPHPALLGVTPGGLIRTKVIGRCCNGNRRQLICDREEDLRRILDYRPPTVTLGQPAGIEFSIFADQCAHRCGDQVWPVASDRVSDSSAIREKHQHLFLSPAKRRSRKRDV